MECLCLAEASESLKSLVCFVGCLEFNGILEYLVQENCGRSSSRGREFNTV